MPDADPVPGLLAAVAALPVSLIAVALLEWAAHRHLMHRRCPGFSRQFEWHTVLHHGRYYRRFDHEPEPAARWFNIAIPLLPSLAALAPLWLPLWLLQPGAAYAFLATVVTHHLLWSLCHDEMHNPGRRPWLRRCWGFRAIARHHFLHHRHPGKNFGALFPWTDYLFGTVAVPTADDLAEIKRLENHRA